MSRASDLGRLEGVAKSWISYESVGTVAIRDSFNSAGLTDND